MMLENGGRGTKDERRGMRGIGELVGGDGLGRGACPVYTFCAGSCSRVLRAMVLAVLLQDGLRISTIPTNSLELLCKI